jgi:hypothetical protein
MRRYIWVIVPAGLLTLLFWMMTGNPDYETFADIHQIERGLRLILGGLFLLVEPLLSSASLLALVVVFGVVAGVLAGVYRLFRQRRWPTLIPVVILLAGNMLFIGTLSFLSAGRVGEPIEDCEFFFDAETVLRVIRYPVEANLEYGEQQFFLISYDGGQAWRQLYHGYAVEPVLRGCDNIQRSGEDGLQIRYESKVSPIQNELIVYESVDGGRSWQQVTDS